MNATDSAGRERDASASVSRDAGEGRGGTSMVVQHRAHRRHVFATVYRGRDCENKEKNKKKRQKREYSRNNENTTMVTYLKAMSFGSFSSIPSTTSARFFASSCRGAVGHGLMVMRSFASPDLYYTFQIDCFFSFY